STDFLHLPGRGHEGIAECGGNIRSGDRCAGRESDRGRQPPGSDIRLQSARPGDPERALLGAALVQALPLARVLGRVRSTGGATALWAGHPPNLVVDLTLVTCDFA